MSNAMGFNVKTGPYNVVPPSHREVSAPSQAHSQWHPVQSTHGTPLSSTMPVRENEVSVYELSIEIEEMVNECLFTHKTFITSR